MICFTLNMPNVGSWNGRWTGEGRGYYKTCRLPLKKQKELDGKSFRHDFGDGWTARIDAEKIDAKEAAKRRKKICGFCNYGWMIDEILKYGRILTLKERSEQKE